MALHWCSRTYPWFWRPALARRRGGGGIVFRWGYLYVVTGPAHISAD